MPIISANELQPPPNLPRRGGTVTIGSMIIACCKRKFAHYNYQSINGLSKTAVTVPPLRGRLGGG